jgi:hypothetical protein
MRLFHAGAGSLIVATIVTAVASLPIVRAQGDDEPEASNDEANRPLILEDVGRLQEQQRLLASRELMRRRITSLDGTATGLRTQLESRLAGRIVALQYTCHLTAAQRKKLELAGRGDIKRLMDRVEPIFGDFASASAGEIHRLAAETRDLPNAVNALFDAGSLFSKTMLSTLTEEQFAENARALREKNSAWYVNAVTDAVRRLARLVDLSEPQSEKLSRLILTETSPPQKVGPADYAFVMFRASKLSKAKLREILDERQWPALERQLASWADAGSILEKQGFVFDDGPPGAVKSDPKDPRLITDRLREHRR